MPLVRLWRDSSCDLNAAAECRPLQRPGQEGKEVHEQIISTCRRSFALKQVTNQLRSWGQEDKPTQDITLGICYRLSAQRDEADATFFRQMEETLWLLVIVLLGDFNNSYVCWKGNMSVCKQPRFLQNVLRQLLHPGNWWADQRLCYAGPIRHE